jgi:hypothetical protein
MTHESMIEADIAGFLHDPLNMIRAMIRMTSIRMLRKILRNLFILQSSASKRTGTRVAFLQSIENEFQ